MVDKTARKYLQNLLEWKIIQAEKAPKRGNTKAVYAITIKIVCKRLAIQYEPVKNISNFMIIEQSFLNKI